MPKKVKTYVEATCDKCGEEVIINEDDPGCTVFLECSCYIFHDNCLRTMSVLEYSELIGMPLTYRGPR